MCISGRETLQEPGSVVRWEGAGCGNLGVCFRLSLPQQFGAPGRELLGGLLINSD